MSFGLIVYNKDGSESFSIKSRLLRYITTYSVVIPSGTTNTVVSVPGRVS